jgi:hypothetical protein
MRTLRFIAPLIAALALLIPSTAGAAIVHAEGGAGANGKIVLWTLDYDDVADTVTIDARYVFFGTDTPVGSDPTQAVLVLEPPAGQNVNVDLLTGHITRGSTDLGLFDPTGNPKLLDSGPRTRTNQKLKVNVGRGRDISFSMLYAP